MSYKITPRAERELENILLYIAEDNPSAADDLEERFFVLFEYLGNMPGMEHSHEDWAKRENVCFFTLRGYIIAYLMDVEHILIFHIVPGVMNLLSHMFE